MELKIAENIKRLRKENYFTQEQLAEALSVTVGAVYKWENNLSIPEIKLLVEIAELFDTSVDAILGYGWDTGNMRVAADRIEKYYIEKDFDEGYRYAERALKKYPNSFEVVYQSAELYYFSLSPKHAGRALELYNDACRLIAQNPYDQVGLVRIHNRMASCYCMLGKNNDAIELLRKNNVEGLNDARIGLFMSQDPQKAEEALKYLSSALGTCYSNFYNLCIGYANAYSYLENLDKISDMMQMLYNFGQGLRNSNVVTYMDRGDVRIFTILAEVSALQGDRQSAREYLLKAKKIAERFDAAPEYRIYVGQKFYHGNKERRAYDDLGETAMDEIAVFISDDTAGAALRPIWEEIKNEAD